MTTIASERRIHIGQVIRNAIVFDCKRRPEEAMSAESLLGIVARLFTLLDEREVDYALAGGVALLQYVEGRNTEDVDLIMSRPSLSRLPEIEIASQDSNFARGRFNALQVDVLLTHNALFDDVRREHVVVRHFVERDIPCVTVEGLILLKLYALPPLYRQGDFARVGIYENDVATLIQAYHPPLDPLLSKLSQHLTESDLSSVRDILAEIELRLKRFGSAFDRDRKLPAP
jgi:hypothetical protein